MIQLFRKIRQRLLTENHFTKYIMYAIGEIILVVIGILIALQINNWNIARNDRKIETQALIDLKTEFVENQEGLERLINIKRGQEDMGRSFLEVISNPNIPISEKIMAQRMGGWNGTWGATNSVLTSLLSTGDITKIQNDSLKHLLTNWSVYVTRFEDSEKIHAEAYAQRRDYLTDKHYGSIVNKGDYSKWPGSFYPNDVDKVNDKLIEQYINDIEYYNLTRNVVQGLHIQLLEASALSENYVKIDRLLTQELEIRGIDQSQGNQD